MNRTARRLTRFIIILAMFQVIGLIVSLIAGHTLAGHLGAGVSVLLIPATLVTYRAYRRAQREA